MTYSTLFPRVLGTYTPEERPKKIVKPNVIQKYDHEQMISDKIAGMSWMEIGKKHCVVTSRGLSGLSNVTRNIVLNSKATYNLSPERLFQLSV